LGVFKSFDFRSFLRADEGGVQTAAKKSKGVPAWNKSSSFTEDIWIPIESLPLPGRILSFYTSSGIEKLYPPQSKAVSAGLLDGKNILISIPTASGKTLLAELAMLRGLELNGKCLYIVPLRALASEKFRRFSEFDALGYKTGISTGDLDSADEYLGSNDIIVATSEKVDSLIRNESHWIHNISVVVLDEVHLLDSPGRGPTLEIIITKIRRMNPKIQIIALSATIQNSKEVADWLGAVSVVSDWRPTRLYEGVYFDGVYEGAHAGEKIKKEIELVGKGREAGISLAADTIRDGGQCLVFASSRKNAVGFAKNAGQVIHFYLNAAEKEELSELAGEISDSSETDAAGVLASCIRMGVAFHHAGLTAAQRELVERSFLAGKIKVISSTPTLAAGLNLPARRVIIAGWRRFDPNDGMRMIPVMEYKQMAGRAGRPHMDPHGESVLIAAKEEDIEKLTEMYVTADPEAVESKLGAENALRAHVLSTIVNGFANTKEQLLSFFKDTFFAYQKGLLSTIVLKTVIDKCLDFLIEADMCRENEKDGATTPVSADASQLFVTADKISSPTGNEEDGDTPLIPTLLGTLVSKLYLDPLSAHIILQNIKKAEATGMLLTEISFLHLFCMTPDMKLLYMKTSDYPWVSEFAVENTEHFISIPPITKTAEYEWFLGELKTALLLYRWISEASENDLSKEFDVGEGDLRQFSENASWIADAGSRLVKLCGFQSFSMLSDLEIRLQYGASIQLLPLLKIRGVGRVRARRLYNAGFHSKESFKPADFVTVAGLIGPKIAEKLYLELGVDHGSYIVKETKRSYSGSKKMNSKSEPDAENRTETKTDSDKFASAQIQKRFDDYF